MAKSTLAALFAQDTLPRRPGQLTAIIDVLAGELAEPADLSAHYLAAWTRLMTARPALPSATADAGQRPEPAPPPAVPAVSAVAPPRPLVPPQARYPAPAYYQPARREPCAPAATHDQPTSVFRQAGGLLVGGTILSVITWLPFAGAGFSFWWVWLCCCGSMLLVIPFTLLSRQPRASSSDEWPAEYIRYEHRRTTERLPGWY
jgi:hypothetical protein